MSEPTYPLTITYSTEPSAWTERDTERGPFRCAYCGKMVMDADGKWVKRDDTALPGQFIAVHRVECRPFRKWWHR